jgi:hypothetical protein
MAAGKVEAIAEATVTLMAAAAEDVANVNMFCPPPPPLTLLLSRQADAINGVPPSTYSSLGEKTTTMTTRQKQWQVWGASTRLRNRVP